MKIAFSISGGGLDAAMDGRFGRAGQFLVYDLDGGTFEIIDNGRNRDAAQGAGIQSAETIVRTGAKALVTGHCGPKAFRVLSAAGLAVYRTEVPMVAEALDLYRRGELARITAADVEGHW